MENDRLVPYAKPSDITYHGEGVYSQKTVLHLRPAGNAINDKPFHKDSDRDMSLAEWQDWIVDLLIKKHNEGCSDNQLRFMFAAEFERRYGNGRKESNA